MSTILATKREVLNPRVATPLGVIYLISCIADIYIAAHDSGKITVMRHQGTVLKGHSIREIVNHTGLQGQS